MRPLSTYTVGVRIAALAASLFASSVALAQEERESVEGHVLELSEQDIVVDLAHARGATDGAFVELWRPLAVKHPVTGQIINDRFLIGRLKLVQVRDSLSLARAEGKLARAAQAGDIVILRLPKAGGPRLGKPAATAPATAPTAPANPVTTAPAAPVPAAPAAPPGAPAASAPAPCDDASKSACDVDAQEVSKLFDGLRGQSPRTRILAYEAFVTRRPKGRYAVVLYEEAQQLRKLVGLLNAGEPVEQVPTRRSFQAPNDALAGMGLEIGVELNDAVGAVFHSRNEGEVAYVSTPMQPNGDGYFTVHVPAERVRPARLEYFIEATTPSGKAVAVVGEAESPFRLPIDPLPAPKPPERRQAIVSVSTDYADWNNFKGNDKVWQTEGFVGMRLNDQGIRAIRTGFGVFRGVGGSLRELDTLKLGGRAVGLTYGYLEGEYGISHFTGIIARVVVGLEDDGVSGGAQALLRLGNDRETNLQIGGEVLGSVGLRGITQLELNSFPKVPVLFRTEVTNQPAGVSRRGENVRPGATGAAQDLISHDQGEVGARAIAQVGYRFLPTLVIAVRGSYQGRTINHAGPGFGGAVSYQW
ncbi:MAG TPA: hypothetical protein VHP33_38730 [Polyangiaceae bacterium]|nr:hypothetical protein [Polyangiaceae bacterium]